MADWSASRSRKATPVAGKARSAARAVTPRQIRTGMLTATCQTANGNWQRTSLSVRDCTSHRAGNRRRSPGLRVAVGRRLRSLGRLVPQLVPRRLDRLVGHADRDLPDRQRNWRRTSLSVRDCTGLHAGNRDGHLVCESPSDAGYGRWEGSFRSSCRDASTDSSGMLTATCQTANGNWQRTSLSVRDCTGLHAGNRDGHLVCERRRTPATVAGKARSAARAAMPRPTPRAC